MPQPSSSPPQYTHDRFNAGFTDDDSEPSVFDRPSRFTLWETKTRFYLVAYNTSQTRFRILKIDRTPGGQQLPQQTSLAATSTSASIATLASTGSNRDDATASADGTTSHTQSHARVTPSSPAYWQLGTTIDHTVYSRSQITNLLDTISDGNRANGGLREVGHFFGLVGFIRFTSTYYMVLISRRSVVSLLGGHYIYHCDETKILPVCHPSTLSSIPGRTKAMDQEEARLLHIFNQVDLSKNFYFSYTYDLTRTLQENLTGHRCEGKAESMAWGYSEKFIWNHHMLLPAFAESERDQYPQHDWVLPMCYGFVDQAKLSVLTRTIQVTLIARRSRHFAGARFLKRGANEAGHVANDVETEQIVSEALTTPFYAPSQHASHDEHKELAQNPRFTSYVMHRGSIPIFWTQDSTNMSPRPPIEISVVDPYYSAAALHFDHMLARYGSPIIILNLIKSKEKTPRESKLLHAFSECIDYLNQFLPADKKMIHVAWDMSRASKSRDQDVIGVLEDIAEETIERTKFFHSGAELMRFETAREDEGFDPKSRSNASSSRRETILTQTGVARVNCVDCLDRTNAAQFVIGKAAFGHQLHALGLLEHPHLPFDSDAVDMLTEMYHDLGDTIALQYGGSHLVNTMETYRKINQWTSHSRDMLEGLKRYYANSFVDADKQAAINLFLGIDEVVVSPSGATRPAPGSKSTTAAVKSTLGRPRRDYQQWFTPSHLEFIEPTPERIAKLRHVIQRQTHFWSEYYRPRLFTDLMRHHAFKVTAVLQYQPADLPRRRQGVPKSPSKHSRRGMKNESISSLASVQSASSDSVPSGSGGGSSSNATLANQSGFSGTTAATAIARRYPHDASVLITSPFTSRLAPQSNPRSPAAQRLRTASTASSASVFASEVGMTSGGSREMGPGSSSPATEAKALIGGVRRWMSLNHADGSKAGGEGNGPGAGASSRRRSGTRRLSEAVADNGAPTGVAPGTTAVGVPTTSTSTTTPIGGWLNPFVPASTTHSTATTLLQGWDRPDVDAQEAREYGLWVQQFQGDLQLEAREFLLDEGGASSGDGGVVSVPSLSDSDLELYMRTVRRAKAGGDWQLSSEAVTHHHSGHGGGIGEAAPTTTNSSTVDPVLLNYAFLAQGGNATLGMHVGIKGASEAKVRAYRNWLAVGKRGA
ncbi:unnamed protein product [Jaminaea pallidilutea]